MKITIKGNEIELRNSIRAFMLYENIENKSFVPATTSDIITFLYCVVLASSRDYSYTLDDIIDAIDENPTSLKEFSEWLITSDSNQNQIKKN